MAIRDAFDFAEILAAIAAAAEGDHIRLTRDYAVFGPYVATAELLITNKNITIGTRSGVSPRIEFGSLYHFVWETTIAKSGTPLIEGDIYLNGSKGGPVWGTPAADGDAVLELRATHPDAEIDGFEFNGLHIDANYAVDRCLRIWSPSGGGVISGNIAGCILENSLDDNLGVAQDSASSSNRVLVTADNVSFNGSRYGRAAGSHFYAGLTVRNSSAAGHRFGAFGPGKNAIMSIESTTIDNPADMCSGSIDGAPINGNPLPMVAACISVDDGANMSMSDCTIRNSYAVGARKRRLIYASSVAASTLTMLRCDVEHEKDGGIIHSDYANTLNITDCVFRHTGDARDYSEETESGGAFGMSSKGCLVRIMGTVNWTRSVLDCQGAVDRAGTAAECSLFDVDNGGAGRVGLLNMEGAVLIRHQYQYLHDGATPAQSHGIIVRSGSSASSYVKGATIVGRLGAGTALNDGVNMTGTRQINVEDSILTHWNNCINAVTSYPGAGRNVFRSAVNKFVPTLGTQASDKPASNASNTPDADVAFVNETYGALDLRLVDGGDAADLCSVDQYRIESYPLALLVSGNGSVARSPLVGARFPQPNDAGAYSKPVQPILLTGTPGSGSHFKRWTGSLSSTTNPDTVNVASPAAQVTGVFNLNGPGGGVPIDMGGSGSGGSEIVIEPAQADRTFVIDRLLLGTTNNGTVVLKDSDGNVLWTFFTKSGKTLDTKRTGYGFSVSIPMGLGFSLVPDAGSGTLNYYAWYGSVVRG